jgi:glycosyltransferase involved in cell wall biosynthesis
MNLDDISVLIISYNEAPNLARTLHALRGMARVVVLDSGSDDGTEAIARAHANVRWHTRAFDDFATQCNHGLSLIDTPWVLSLDADHVLEADFLAELINLDGAAQGYAARFRYCVNGVPLRASLLPPRTVLFRRAAGRYVNDGHAHRIVVPGAVPLLHARIRHDDRKPLSRWLTNQERYARHEVAKLRAAGATLGLADRIRRWRWLAPPLVFAYTLFVRGAVFDGWRGWHYAYQRAVAEAVLAMRLIEADWPAANDRESSP